MTADGYVIRNLTRDELNTVVEWAAAEAWNPGRHDAEAFYAADPTGFYAGLLDGELIGSISAVKYGAGYVFWGFYIVKPEHRGKKYGLRLWRHAVHAVQDVPGDDGKLGSGLGWHRPPSTALEQRNSHDTLEVVHLPR